MKSRVALAGLLTGLCFFGAASAGLAAPLLTDEGEGDVGAEVVEVPVTVDPVVVRPPLGPDTCDKARAAKEPFAGGSGTATDPYQICSVAQLDRVRDYWTANFKLMTDLDLKGVAFRPIAHTTTAPGTVWAPPGWDGWWAHLRSLTLEATAYGHYFRGTFDGGFHTISNLVQTAESIPVQTYYGLFGAIVGGSVHSLRVTNARISTIGHPWGGFSAGILATMIGIQVWNYPPVPNQNDCCSGGRIHDVDVEGAVDAGNVAGGLAASATGAQLTRVSVNLVGNARGALLGSALGCWIDNVVTSGLIGGGGPNTGGVVGYLSGPPFSRIYNVFSNVVLTQPGGAIVGGTSAGSTIGTFVIDSYWNSSLAAGSGALGGAPLTPAQMGQASSYGSGWDFENVWRLVPGGPPELRFGPATGK